MKNGFAFNHDKKFANLLLCKASSKKKKKKKKKNDFLKDVESTVDLGPMRGCEN